MERLKALDELNKPDSRMGSFVARVRATGEIRPKTIEDVYWEVSHAKLVAAVPERLRSAFATVQNLYLYSWFVYGFTVVADLQMYATLEFALRLKLDPKGAHPRRTLRPLFQEAIRRRLVVDAGVVDLVLPPLGTAGRNKYEQERAQPGRDDQQYVKRLAKSFSASRNDLAHGTFALWPSQILNLYLLARIVDQLFAAPGA